MAWLEKIILVIAIISMIDWFVTKRKVHNRLSDLEEAGDDRFRERLKEQKLKRIIRSLFGP